LTSTRHPRRASSVTPTDRTFYVYNREDAAADALVVEDTGARHPLQLDAGARRRCVFDDQYIMRSWRGKREQVLKRSEFTPVGVHNLENALASVATATALDVPLDATRSALGSTARSRTAWSWYEC
jgi:UDP-N-acetylmuramoylalanine-D-glutamate ligase